MIFAYDKSATVTNKHVIRIIPSQRGSPAFYSCMRKCALVFVALASHNAFSQIVAGTIVITQKTQDKLIVVADSRALYPFQGTPPDDSQCKISALGHQFIFAASGAAVVPAEQRDSNHWTNSDVASEVYASDVFLESQKSGQSRVDRIVMEWARRIERNWQMRYMTNPDEVVAMANQGIGTLTIGFFADVENGEFVSSYVGITLSGNPMMFNAVIGVPKDSCTDDRCAMGKTHIFTEYARPGSLLSKREGLKASPELLQRIGLDTLTDIRIVDLTIAYDKPDATGIVGVGGRIDAVELWKDSSIHWIQEKESCPENQD